VAAANYFGVSPTLFDRMVRDRLAPRPIRIYGRRVWDRFELDAAFDALPRVDAEAADGHEHDEWSIRP
jgi:hypothetical protein